MLLDCDFHIHSRYSGATSEQMNFEVISEQAPLKGLSVVGTGDALHHAWLKEIKSLKLFSDGIYEKRKCKFVITTEVEDARRVHHLIFLPEISSAESLRETFKKFSVDIDRDGRPHLRLNGEELVDYVGEVGGFLGPAHAFVPWTSIYKEYGSIKECYGDNVKKIKFLELGLSADTYLADCIEELQELTFLSNSDAHSPWPHRLGREFNRLLVKELTFKDIRKAIERNENKVVLNVGFDPRLGKYHSTACIKCFRRYELEEATKLKWRCMECGGILKKGVRDRIKELGSIIPKHPEHRPKYIRIAPLAEILCLALKVKNIYSPEIQENWKKLVSRFGSEISVLVDAPIEEIKKESNGKVAELIAAFREGKFEIVEGGGGKYGEIVFNGARRRSAQRRSQAVLDDYGL